MAPPTSKIMPPKFLDNWVWIESDVAVPVKEIHGVDKASDMYRRKLGFHG